MSEAAFIDWVRSRAFAQPRVVLGPGDDAAIFDFPADSRCLISTDMLLEGACFRLAEAAPRRVGRKAIAVNLSDMAAMAGKPLAAVVAVGLPKSFGMDQAKELFVGMEEIAKEFSLAIIGGDTNTWEGPLAISVTILGESTERGAVRRSGARVGDWIFVTGPLGGSILGHHLDFRPRVREALALHAACDLHSLTDISDGFARDLSHITTESRCGAVIYSHQIPISDAARQLKDNRSALEHALSDGEDYELIFTVSADDGRRLVANGFELPFPVFHVGECVEQGLWIEDDGVREPLEPRGYEHRFNDA